MPAPGGVLPVMRKIGIWAGVMSPLRSKRKLAEDAVLHLVPSQLLEHRRPRPVGARDRVAARPRPPEPPAARTGCGASKAPKSRAKRRPAAASALERPAAGRWLMYTPRAAGPASSSRSGTGANMSATMILTRVAQAGAQGLQQPVAARRTGRRRRRRPARRSARPGPRARRSSRPPGRSSASRRRRPRACGPPCGTGRACTMLPVRRPRRARRRASARAASRASRAPTPCRSSRGATRTKFRVAGRVVDPRLAPAFPRAAPPRVRPGPVFDGLIIATGPPGARFRIGISTSAQKEE